jgi:peptidoglycan/xylan/chitin deacetylase (PgdA/CDA1 family)
MRLATVSIDDGHARDADMILLLDALGIRGTFYLCPGWLDRARCRCMREEIPGRYARQEVGNHTRNHAEFDALPREQWHAEIADGRRELEALFGRAVTVFCYPFGAVYAGLPDVVQATGHRWGRTVAVDAEHAERDGDPYRRPVTRQRFWPVPDAAMLLRRRHVHLCGHAYELAENNGWAAFAALLRSLQGAGFKFVTNMEYWETLHGDGRQP